VAPTEVLDHLDADDVLIVTRLDRLARSTRDLLNVLAAVGERGAGFKSLKDARGVRFGRPRSLTPHQRQEAMQRLADGEVQADLARSYGVSQATISRLSGDRPFEASAAGAQLSAEGRRSYGAESAVAFGACTHKAHSHN
jgi:DNA invertase Pin-like site-specific DNA recombinase